MTDRFDLSRRKLLGVVGTIGGAAALGGAGTMAFFSDTEEFANNQLTAGELDLKVAWQEHYADWLPDTAGGPAAPQETDDARMPGSSETPSFRLPPGPGQSDASAIELVLENEAGESSGQEFLSGSRIEVANGGLYGGPDSLCETDADSPGAPLFELSDVKPGDFGFGLFRLELCTNPGKLWLSGGLNAANENGFTEPESEDEDEFGDAGATNPALVELLDEIQVAFGVGTTNDLAATDPMENLLPDPDASSTVPQPATQYSLREFLTLVGKGDGIPLSGDVAAEDGGGMGRPCFGGESGYYVSVVWWLPIDHGNQVQGDSATFDLGFYTEQCRHNGTADTFVARDATFSSLQAAVSDADEGDVVEVGPGTFETNGQPLIVDTPGLTLRSVGTRARIERTDPGTNAAVSITADGVTFEGFEVSYPGGLLGIRIGDGTSGGSSGVTVRNNRVRDVGPIGRLGVSGIIAQGGTQDNLTIECNLVENLRNEINASSPSNFVGRPTVNGIIVDDTSSSDSVVDSTIVDNVVRDLDSDYAPIGIILNATAENVSVRGNYVTDLLASDSVDSDDTDDAADYAFTFAQGINISGTTSDVEVVENTITDVTSEVQFVGEAVKIDGDASGVALNRNNLLAPIGVNNADSDELDAEDNWWGSPSGPEVASANPPSTTDEDRRDVLGNVDFDPFASSSQ